MSSPKNPAADLLTAFGSLAELAHHFYTSMINVGASKEEATAGMQEFIRTQIAIAMNGGPKKGGDRDGTDE